MARSIRRRRGAVGFFGIETPESIVRKVQALGLAWDRLAASFPSVPLVQSEKSAYKIFQKSVEDSWLSRIFASSTAPEFEQWMARYASAYDAGAKQSPGAVPLAPAPSAINPPPASASKWLFAGLGAAAVIGLVFLLRR